jgi:hypothetical protein
MATANPIVTTSFDTADGAEMSEDQPLERQTEQRSDDHHRQHEPGSASHATGAGRSTTRPTRTPAHQRQVEHTRRLVREHEAHGGERGPPWRS